jgi:hypothetical protein
MFRSFRLAFGILVTLSVSGALQTPANALPRCPVSKSQSAWKHCKGTIRLPDGAKYTGEFRNGVAYGYGRYTSRQYGNYVGQFYKGKFHGKGTLWAPNRWKYSGEFRYGKLNGQATATAPNGTKTKGLWRNGALVRQYRK